MFEVKGWKLSAPLKTDTSIAKKRVASDDPERPVQQTKPKKQKRGHGQSNGVNITAENLAEVWQEHIEGRPVAVQKHDGAGEVLGRKEKKSQFHSVGDEGGQKKHSNKPKVKHGERKRHGEGQEAQDAVPQTVVDVPSSGAKSPRAAPPTQVTTAPKLTALQSKMSHKLASARFRHLNQQLYTTPSKDSLSLFTANPEVFADYHAGFAQQVEVWPENPVDSFVSDIITKGKVRGPPAGMKGKHRNEGPKEVRSGDAEPLPRIRDRGFQCVIADLGCGTAKLASTLQPHLKKLNLKIHSFDLHAPSSLVTVADIAHLPMADGSVDVAIACLALMGTNWIDFVEEAWRVLRWKGEFWVAEIKSRFSRSTNAPSTTGPAHSISKRQQKKQGLVGKAAAKKDRVKQDKDDQEQLEVEVDGVAPTAGAKGETDVSHFVTVLERRGFVLDGTPDLGNKMFVKMRFVKAIAPARGKHVMKDAAVKSKKFVDKADEDEFDEGAVLKPCVYKLR